MKQVFFEKLWMENFCNHINRIEIEFILGKLVIITGPNGSGKTSMLQALPYALFGICEKGRGDDVLNDKTLKNCCAGVRFRIANNVYSVERFIKYTKVGTTVILKKNGKVICQGHKEVVPEVERILISKESFNNTLMFSQKVKTFFTDLVDSDQKKIFRKVLKLGNYVLFGDETTKRLKSIAQIVLDLNRRLDLNIGLQKENETILNTLQKEKKEFDTKKKNSISEFNDIIKVLEQRKIIISTTCDEYIKIELDDNLTKVSGKIGSITSDLKSLNNDLFPKLKSIDDQKELKKAEMKQSSEKIKTEARDKRDKKKNDLTEVSKNDKNNLLNLIDIIDNITNKIDIKLASLESENKYLTKDKEKLELNISSLTDPTCPLCKSPINEEKINLLKNEVKEFEDKISKNKISISEFTEEKETNFVDKNKYNKDYDSIESAERKALQEIESEYNETCTSATSRLESATEKIDIFAKHQKANIEEETEKESSDTLRELNTLRAERKTLEENILDRDNKQRELNDLNVRLAKISEGLKKEKENKYDETQLKVLIEKSIEFKIDVKKLVDERIVHGRRVEILEFWKQGFSNSGIQSLLIDDSIPFMNERIAYYMEKLCNGRYTVTFDTLNPTKGGEFRDKIQVNVFDNVTHADSRVKFSGGQKRLVDIGSILTLHDLQSQVQDIEFNILLFDEIFDSLDEQNTEYTAKLIRQVSKDKWTGVISHTKIDAIEADEILSFS
jgi:energy-coupling factor transporter ATP-binding protein EcfA2